MISICEDRYGRGWVAFSCDPEDIPAEFNSGDGTHDDFYRATHSYPIGWGWSPDMALGSLRWEVHLYQTIGAGYRCRLADQEAKHPRGSAPHAAVRLVSAFLTYTRGGYSVENANADLRAVEEGLYGAGAEHEFGEAAEVRRVAARVMLGIEMWRALPESSPGIFHLRKIAGGVE